MGWKTNLMGGPLLGVRSACLRRHLHCEPPRNPLAASRSMSIRTLKGQTTRQFRGAALRMPNHVGNVPEGLLRTGDPYRDTDKKDGPAILVLAEGS